jgi:putative endonuclease
LVKGGYVYIMTNKPFGVLYVGVTADLSVRITAHREGRGSWFCRQWGLKRLVYLERYEEIEAAISREKQVKAWMRVWKTRLVSEANPTWNDLYETING